MTKGITLSPRARHQIASVLISVFMFYTLFMIFFRLSLVPPGASTFMFIGEAKIYYFEGSTLEEKDSKFDSAEFKDYWLAIPSVTEVVTTEEGKYGDIEFGGSASIGYVVIDGTVINRLAKGFTPRKYKAYREALNKVSAYAWEQAVKYLFRGLVVWTLLLIALIWTSRQDCLSNQNPDFPVQTNSSVRS